MGLVIGLTAVVTLRRFNLQPKLRDEAQLVTHGIFRWVRNPMYLGLLLLFGPPAFTAPYSYIQLGGIALLTVVLALKIRSEERFLRAEFSEYAAYAARTKRLIPFTY